MIDVNNIVFGGVVTLNRPGHAYDGDRFLVLGYELSVLCQVEVELILESNSTVFVRARPEELEYVSAPQIASTIEVVTEMRNAGPPQPDRCSCDIVSLMNIGCRCGWLGKEREGKKNS